MDSTSKNKVGTTNNCINIMDKFRSNTSKETDRRVNRLLTVKIHNYFNDIHFEGTFKLLKREGSHPYQAPLRRVGYALLRTTM